MANPVCVLWAKCEACQYGCHYDEPTEHTWMEEDDIDHRRLIGKPIPDPLPRCGCWCTGFEPGAGNPIAADVFAELSRQNKEFWADLDLDTSGGESHG